VFTGSPAFAGDDVEIALFTVLELQSALAIVHAAMPPTPQYRGRC